jgi:hypothetical protein
LKKIEAKKGGQKLGVDNFVVYFSVLYFYIFMFVLLVQTYHKILHFCVCTLLLDVLGNKGLKELAECFCFNGCVTFTENTIRENTA